MSDSNGYDSRGEDQRIERKVDDVASHLPRVGELERIEIERTAAYNRLGREVRVLNDKLYEHANHARAEFEKHGAKLDALLEHFGIVV